MPCLPRPVRSVSKRIFDLRNEEIYAFVIGLFAGFPSGAVCAYTLAEHNTISPDRAARLSCISGNAGAAFLLSGTFSLFGQRRTGIIVFVCQTLASLTVAALSARVCRGTHGKTHGKKDSLQKADEKKDTLQKGAGVGKGCLRRGKGGSCSGIARRGAGTTHDENPAQPGGLPEEAGSAERTEKGITAVRKPMSAAFSDAVSSASSAMVSVLGTTVFFSVLLAPALAVLPDCAALGAASFTEISSAMRLIAKMPLSFAHTTLLCAGASGWTGLSVMFQSCAVSGGRLPLTLLMRYRLLCAFFCMLFAFAFLMISGL